MHDIGRKIKLLREEKGLTQEQLAHMVGYKSRVSINKIELQRDIPINKVVPIANALDVEPSVLMGWTDEPITIDIEERKDDVMEQLVDTYAKRELLTPFIKMLNEMPEDYRTKALNYIKEVYKEYLFDKAMKGE